jgi:asparagine synthase (glutamine-hydrolysing)
MCGIAGYLNFDGSPVQPEVVQAMINRIAHRGPDAEGIYTDKIIGLGHRRLSILDLSESGRQPMSDQSATIWLTFNGEIYNFWEIRYELEAKGYIFHSTSDTEMIIYAYQEWGRQCVERFNGMFAFALWDTAKQSLWLVRDRLGIKPLFYAHLGQTFLFGSEIKALLTHPMLTNRDLDYEALAYYLATNYVPIPYTLFQHVRQILPGHYLIISAGGHIEDVEYWKLCYHEDDYQNDKFYLDAFNELLEDAVHAQLISDVPFGSFLSGGLDSSSIAYLMSHHLEEPVKTFSIGFDEDSYSELPYARQVAQRIGANHFEFTVKPGDAALVEQLVWHAEEPTADSSMIGVYRVAEMARQHVKMVHSGDGADEIMAGYPTYTAYYLHQMYHRIPGFIRNRIPAALSLLPVSDTKMGLDTKVRRFISGAQPASGEDAHALWRIIFDSSSREALIKPIQDKPGIHADIQDLYRSWFKQSNAQHPLNRLLYVDTCLYLPSDMLIKVDRMTMAHGLEARVPFLDHRLVEFMARVPPHLKLNRYTNGKYLLKRAMRDKLPQAVLQRKKAGFNIPKSTWMKNELKSFVVDLLSPSHIQKMGLFDSTIIQHLLQDHFDQKADNSHQIWGLLVLSLWWEQFIGNKSP